MKEKTQKRTVWAARDSRATYLCETEPTWISVHNEWDGFRIASEVSNLVRHNSLTDHYGLRPGQKKKLVVELYDKGGGMT